MNAILMPTQTGSIRSGTPVGNGGDLPRKWNLLKAAEEAREPLGLKRTSLAVLRAMISLVRTNHISDAAADEHICFASNATLAHRVHVSTKTVERHITILANAGLVRRVTSGNGKRWARRDEQGRVVLASGLSLLPLAEKYAQLVQKGHEHTEAVRKLSLLKDRCLMQLNYLTAQIGDEGPINELVKKARNILRRKPNEIALKNLLVEITNEASNCGYVEEKADNLRGADSSFEGHKETDLIQEVKDETSPSLQVKPEEMEHSFPRLCAELRFAKNSEQCERMMTDLADYLGIGTDWYDLKMEHGPAISFMLMGYVLQKSDKIRNHRAYFLSLSKKIRSAEITYRSLLRKGPQ